MVSSAPEPTRPVPEPLAGFIAGELMNAIEQGHYKPGTRLVEAEIAESFGVSRAPVREALRMLMQDDLVMRRPRRGTIVTDLSPRELSEMFEVRSALYAAIIRLFTRRATAEELDQYTVLRERILEFAQDASTTPALFVDATQAASAFVVAHCGNARMQANFRKMTRQSYRVYAELAHSTAAHRQKLASFTGEILAAMRAGDAERASMVAWRLTEANHAAALAAIEARAQPG